VDTHRVRRTSPFSFPLLDEQTESPTTPFAAADDARPFSLFTVEGFPLDFTGFSAGKSEIAYLRDRIIVLARGAALATSPAPFVAAEPSIARFLEDSDPEAAERTIRRNHLATAVERNKSPCS